MMHAGVPRAEHGRKRRWDFRMRAAAKGGDSVNQDPKLRRRTTRIATRHKQNTSGWGAIPVLTDERRTEQSVTWQGAEGERRKSCQSASIRLTGAPKTDIIDPLLGRPLGWASKQGWQHSLAFTCTSRPRGGGASSYANDTLIPPGCLVWACHDMNEDDWGEGGSSVSQDPCITEQTVNKQRVSAQAERERYTGHRGPTIDGC